MAKKSFIIITTLIIHFITPINVFAHGDDTKLLGHHWESAKNLSDIHLQIFIMVIVIFIVEIIKHAQRVKRKI